MNQPAQTLGERSAKAWNVALSALVFTLLAILVLYRETASAMVEIWARSETFTHGFLVPPITLWLIWRIRYSIAQITPCANPWVLLAIAVAGFAWLLGEVATVGVLSQFALVSLLVLAVPAILGMQVAKRIAFPLAFLFFAVPFGEFALPQLMEWTANFTVLGLRLSGIPVFREGLHFVIPSGNWSVVEACSGVRYIIASLTVGTLFAYLSYQSLKRRLIFVGVSFVVPVVANWLRAYMIVIIGHLSGNQLAVGVDHLIYGWAFFGIVIMAMFWIGSHWREDEPTLDAERSNGVAHAPVENSALARMVFAVCVLACVWPLALWQIERNVPPQVARIEPLDPIDGWPISAEMLNDWKPRFENPSATLQSTFDSGTRKAGLYIGYYRDQGSTRKMVSSVNVLVNSSNSNWVKATNGSRQISLGQQHVSVKTAELRSPASSRLVVWQWYWINGHLTANDHLAKAYTALSRLMGQGDDSAVIILYAPKDQAGDGVSVLEDFAKAAGSAIESALKRTQEKR